jgi:hypothetical protein
MTTISTSAGADVPEKKAKGLTGLLETTRDFMKISQQRGGLVPQSTVATILGVSRQRVHQLVTEGTLSHWTFYGMKWLSQEEVVAFAKLNRKAGENQHKPSAKQMWKDSQEVGREFVKKRRASGH